MNVNEIFKKFMGKYMIGESDKELHLINRNMLMELKKDLK